jgi:hypothetical protein
VRAHLRSLKSPRRIRNEKRKCGGGSRGKDREAARKRTKGAGQGGGRLFTFRTNSISSGFCLIANAAGKRKMGGGVLRFSPRTRNAWRAKFCLQKESRITVLAVTVTANVYALLIISQTNEIS